MGSFKCLVAILQNIAFCVQQKIEIHTCLEQLKSEQIMTKFSFFGELFL